MIYRLVIFSFLFAQSAWAEMKVYATTDQNRIVLNETLSLKVTAEESNDFPKLDISAIKDFTVISGPGQSSSFQWVNGKMSLWCLGFRSEERRVGKECRSRWSPYH